MFAKGHLASSYGFRTSFGRGQKHTEPGQQICTSPLTCPSIVPTTKTKPRNKQSLTMREFVFFSTSIPSMTPKTSCCFDFVYHRLIACPHLFWLCSKVCLISLLNIQEISSSWTHNHCSHFSCKKLNVQFRSLCRRISKCLSL